MTTRRGSGARRHLGASVLTAVLLAGAGCGTASDPADFEPSVARLAGTACLAPILGSAVVVGDGLVLTVAHAVAGAEADLHLVFPDGEEYPVRVVGFDPERDLALLTADGLTAPAVPIGEADAGDTGFIAAVTPGYVLEPIAYEVRRRITARISNIYNEGKVERAALDVDASVGKGVSGAGLIDDDGHLVGIVYATSRELDSVTYALAAAEMNAFLAEVDPGTEVDAGRCR